MAAPGDPTATMVLFVCDSGADFRAGPGPFEHPCHRAAKALDAAGHRYEVREVKGGSLKFWTWPSRGSDRAEVERLSGQRSVPILVVDGDAVVTGSGGISRWAREHAAA
ncbi:MAG TPA: glutaredoxin domain-containing protein [Solirubrobacteraceae bacterium]|nr:glutaredoxin domain-containing protein [Solirubrobacteraceae bacterium]